MLPFLWNRVYGRTIEEEKIPDNDQPCLRSPDDDKNDFYLVWLDQQRYFRYRYLIPGKLYTIQKDYVFPRLIPIRKFVPHVFRDVWLYYQILPLMARSS